MSPEPDEVHDADTALAGNEPASEPANEPANERDDWFYRVVHVESVLFDLADSAPQVHLMEAEAPYRSLSIPVALPEAIAMHAALYNHAGRRPGTHELFASVLARIQCDVIAAKITRYEGGVYFGELDLMTPRGREIVDCRTSDALIMALRQAVVAPILCRDDILAAANGA